MKILFLGDSITDMDRNRNFEDGHVVGLGTGYVFIVASELYKRSPIEYQVLNRGCSGNRVVDLYARIKKDVWNHKPDLLSILIGTNDVWHEIRTENGVDLERWERMYRLLLKETKERFPETKFIMLEPFVLKGSATEDNIDRFNQIREYAKRAKVIAKDFGIPFVELQEDFDRLSEKYGVEHYLYDGVHPATAGAKLIADNWLKVFDENFK